jgi:hypothetical protein
VDVEVNKIRGGDRHGGESKAVAGRPQACCAVAKGGGIGRNGQGGLRRRSYANTKLPLTALEAGGCFLPFP